MVGSSVVPPSDVLTRICGAAVTEAYALDENGETRPMKADAWGPNLMAPGAIFLLKKA